MRRVLRADWLDVSARRSVVLVWLRVPLRRRLARARAACRRMLLVARILALVVGIRPLGLVRLAHRAVQPMVGLGIARASALVRCVPAHWPGAAAERSARVERGSRSAAGSPDETLPAARPPP